MLKKACYIILLMHIQTEAGLFDKSFQELKLEAESLAKRHQTIKRVLTSIKQSNSDKITLKQHLETVSDNIDKWEQRFCILSKLHKMEYHMARNTNKTTML